MSKARNISNLFSSATDLATDAEVTAAIANKANLTGGNTFTGNQILDGGSTTTIVDSLRFNNSGNAASNGNKISWYNAGTGVEASNISSFREGAGLGYVISLSTTSNFSTTAASEKIRIDSSGNVGIGSNSPSTFGKLAVVGGIYRVSQSSGEEPIIVHSFANGNYSAGMYSINTFSGNYGNGLLFKTTDTSGNTAERMRITSTGQAYLNIAQDNGQPRIRNTYTSTSGPSGGNDGDVWLTYTA